MEDTSLVEKYTISDEAYNNLDSKSPPYIVLAAFNSYTSAFVMLHQWQSYVDATLLPFTKAPFSS